MASKDVDVEKQEAITAGKEAEKKQEVSPSSVTGDSKKETALPVILDHELQRFVDLGLGRGVNATDPTPWQNKSSFQVREVTDLNIIGTDEGGAVQSYETEVHSTFALQTELQASITIPQSPVTIGVDAEQSRSVSSSRKAVGVKVLNRTISFRADFRDVPFRKSQHAGHGGTDETDGPLPELQQSQLTFEERLSTWIVERMKAHDKARDLLESAKKEDKNEIHAMLKCASGDNLSKSIIKEACSDFAHTFNITHYVCAIHLGAAEYNTYTEEDYNLKLKTSASVGVDNIGGGSGSVTSTWKKTSKKSYSRTIGHMTKETTKTKGTTKTDWSVKRGSCDEAVVGVKLSPITALITSPILRRHFQTALEDYVEELQDLSHGPFYISTHNESLFLSVDKEDYTVRAVDVTAKEKFHEASLFFIIPTDNAAHPNEFYITYRGDSFKPKLKSAKGSVCGEDSAREKQMQRKKQLLHGIPRYLDAPIERRGRPHGPLQLKYHIRESNSRFTLINRVIKGSKPVSPAPWLAHRDIFFIKCARRGFLKQSYLAVKRCIKANEWISCCIKSKKAEDNKTTCMLFRLLPKTYVPSGHELADEGKASESGERKAIEVEAQMHS